MVNYTKFKRILGAVLLVNILLVGTHEGEFWPFSIFPMFSQAGNPWTRGVVERVGDPSAEGIWKPRTLEELRGGAVGLYERGVDPIDFANFVGKTREWDRDRTEALRELLDARELRDTYWAVHRVRGYLAEGDSVVVESTPLMILSADTTIRNPKIFSPSP